MDDATQANAARRAAVVDYMETCAEYERGPRDSSPWRLNAYEVEFMESWEVVHRFAWQIERADADVLPVPRILGPYDANLDVRVATLAGERSTQPVARSILETLGGAEALSSTSWRNFLAVRLQPDEIGDAPMVTVAVRGPVVKQKLSPLAALRPAASMELKFAPGPDHEYPTRFTISSDATAQFAMLHCKMIWSVVSESLDRSIADAEIGLASGALDDAAAAVVLDSSTDSIHLQCTGAVRILRALVHDSTARTLKPLSTPRHWSRDLRVTERALRDWLRMRTGGRNARHPAPKRTFAIAKRDALALRSRLATRSDNLAIGIGLDDNGNADIAAIDRSGPLGELSAGLQWEYMQMPFSTGRESETGARSFPFHLAALSMVLAVPGVLSLDLFGIGTKLVADGHLGPGETAALVTVLVVFPVALYPQFLQTRPREPLSRRAGAARFRALSALYGLPMAPALWLALGGNGALFGWLCVGIAGVVLAVAAVVGIATSQAGLKSARRREILRSRFWRPRWFVRKNWRHS